MRKALHPPAQQVGGHGSATDQQTREAPGAAMARLPRSAHEQRASDAGDGRRRKREQDGGVGRRDQDPPAARAPGEVLMPNRRGEEILEHPEQRDDAEAERRPPAVGVGVEPHQHMGQPHRPRNVATMIESTW